MTEPIDLNSSDTQRLSQLLVTEKLRADLLRHLASKPLSKEEARFLVDLYYSQQKLRIHLSNQINAIHREAKKNDTKEEPHELIMLLFNQYRTVEDNIKRALGYYIQGHPIFWFFDQTLGVGPVIASGLCAHIDIQKAITAGAIWRFAGIDPTQTWQKGEKRPWNASLKTLCWKLGDSFVKISGREDAFYGQIYRKRKEQEITLNEKGVFSDQAQKALETKNFRENQTKKIYESGKLPPGHLDARARRYAVKLFLSHLHQRWREQEGLPLTKPWIIEHGGHSHYIEPPQRKI